MSWLRRLFRRPPTIRDCIRAARSAPCEPIRAPERVVEVTILDWEAYDAWQDAQ